MEQQQSNITSNMNLRATIEVLVHFNSFRNIDLFHQGIYQLKTTIYQKIKNQYIYATPYNIVQGSIPEKKGGTQQSKYFREAQSEDISFYSKAFAIRYCEELVELNDMCIFRADFINAYPIIQEEDFYMEVDLLFVDLAMQHSEQLFRYGPEDGTKVVATFKSKLHSTFNNMHEYIPITFDELHFACVNSSVHSVLRDFTFKNIPEHHPIQKLDESQDISKENSRKNSNKDVQDTLFSGYQPMNFKEFLTYITSGFQRSQLDEFYMTYVKFLRLQHENFLIYYLSLIDECVIDQTLAKTKKSEVQIQFQAPYQKFMEIKQQSIISELNKNQNNSLSTSNSSNLTEQEKINGLMLNSQFSDYFQLDSEKEFDKVCTEIQSEINNIAGCSFQLWYDFIDFLKKYVNTIQSKLEDEYNIKLVKRFKESIFQSQIKIPDISSFVKKHVGKDHEKEAKKIRNKHYYQTLAPMNVEDLRLAPKPSLHPIIFSDTYIKDKTANQIKLQKPLDISGKSSSQEESKNGDENLEEDEDEDDIKIPCDDAPSFVDGKSQNLQIQSTIEYKNLSTKQYDSNDVHVMVMVHGYQGNNYDMRLFKDNLALKYPDIQFLSSSANEDYTDGNIWDMGQRLAEEVRRFIKEWCPGGCTRLSFVGHSLGGLIIRSALTHLQDYSSKFHTFFTLSSPHLGFLYHNSKMVDAGLWFMKTWKKCQSLKQMTLSDSKEIENTFIYKLAHTGGLNTFKHIVLVSSYQDSYVPYYSARIQNTPKRSNNDSNRSIKYAEILNAILGNIEQDRIHRIDVAFEIPEKSLDTMIGRAAHIQFLENMTLQKMFAYNFNQFFE